LAQADRELKIKNYLRPLPKGSTKRPQHTIKTLGKTRKYLAVSSKHCLKSLDILEEAVWHH
jgi:hypothetical protein